VQAKAAELREARDAADAEQYRLELIAGKSKEVLDALLEFFSSYEQAGKPITPKLQKAVDKWRLHS